MSERRKKLKKGWKAIRKKVDEFVSESEPSPAIMVLYMKEGRDSSVRFAGSPELQRFANQISLQFKDAVLRKEVSAGGTGTSNLQPSVTALTSVDPKDVIVKHLRIIISSLVADHVKSTGDVKRGYDSDPNYRPPWWLDGIPFQSLNDRRGNKDQLKLPDLQRLLASYQAYVSLSDGVKDIGMDVDDAGEADISPSDGYDVKDGEFDVLLPNSEKKTDVPQAAAGTSAKKDEVPFTSNNDDCKQQDIDCSKITQNILQSLASLSYTDLCRIAEKMLSSIRVPQPVALNEPSDDRFKVPEGFVSVPSLEQGDCLFSSLSLLLYGNNAGKDLLRLGCGLFGTVYANAYVEKFIVEGTNNLALAKVLLHEVSRTDVIDSLGKVTDFRLLISQVIKAEAQLTFRPTSYSGFLQVLFAAGFTQRQIVQFSEGVQQSDFNIFTSTVAPYPQLSACHEAPMHIMWVPLQTKQSPNHIVPLLPKKRVARSAPKRNGWEWIEHPASTQCKAKMLNWCVHPVEPFTLVECCGCQSMSHPECFGVAREKSTDWYCCNTKDVPNLDVIECNGHILRMTDIISIQPSNWYTNWLVDFFVGTSFPDDDGQFFCFPSVLWEVLRRNNKFQMQKYGKVYSEHLNKPILIFPIVEGGHWMTAVLIERQKIVFLDSLIRKNYLPCAEKIARFVDVEVPSLHIEVADVPQQANGSDCGPYTVYFLHKILQALEHGTCKDDLLTALQNIPQKDPLVLRRCFKRNIFRLQKTHGIRS